MQDWQFLIENPENVCVAALDGATVIGTATAIRYKNYVAWIGMVLVDRNYRGMGVSKMLLSSLFEQLKLCRSIKLDATPAGQSVYQKFGFKDEYLINRMTTTSVLPGDLIKGEWGQVENAQNVDVQEIVEYDQRVFGANRKELIAYLVHQYAHKALVLRRNGSVVGFALGREGTHFHHIGPVMAASAEEAKQLIATALAQLRGQPVVIDVLENKKELISWLNTLGFTKQRHFIRMYQHHNPFPGIPERQHLICGPEFG